MHKDDLVEMMIGLLVETLEDEGSRDPGQVTSSAPLLGANAIVSSLALVTFITDVESVLEEEHGIHVTLTSEDAFSRKQSPFRTVEALADYILELSEPPANDAVREAGGE